MQHLNSLSRKNYIFELLLSNYLVSRQDSGSSTNIVAGQNVPYLWLTLDLEYPPSDAPLTPYRPLTLSHEFISQQKMVLFGRAGFKAPLGSSLEETLYKYSHNECESQSHKYYCRPNPFNRVNLLLSAKCF